jgi:site-specific DNA-methyltransferase (cytosine-N4-specific)
MAKKLSQSQLLLPLLETIDKAGGSLRAKAAADALAERIGLSAAEREAKTATTGGKVINSFDRDVRWVHQLAKLRGLTTNDGPGCWQLTGKASDKLHNARPGIVVTVFETMAGIALWATAEAVEARMGAESINLILTSPPYPLLRKKAYGNLDEKAHLDWLVERARAWKEMLADDGSLFLNTGDCWMPGTPTASLYQERLLLALVDDLGYHLAQRLYWENPAKLPAPAEWVNIRRIRVTPSVEQILWLSKTPWPKADNRAVLRPYSSSMHATLAAGGTNPGLRPSGHAPTAGAFARDNGGSIPHSLLSIPNTASNDPYTRACRASGQKPHPARFPLALAEFAIKLTTHKGDLVYDPFAGSLTVAQAAEGLGRRWIASEQSRTYLEGGRLRFPALA